MLMPFIHHFFVPGAGPLANGGVTSGAVSVDDTPLRAGPANGRPSRDLRRHLDQEHPPPPPPPSQTLRARAAIIDTLEIYYSILNLTFIFYMCLVSSI
jgi:hypothetical protein